MSKRNERGRTKFRVSEAEREALDRSALDVREDRFASEKQVAALFNKYRTQLQSSEDLIEESRALPLPVEQIPIQ